MAAPHPLMTSPEVARALRVSIHSINRYAADERLVSFRVGEGGDLRFWRAEIDAIRAGKPFTAADLDRALERALDDAIGERL